MALFAEIFTVDMHISIFGVHWCFAVITASFHGGDWKELEPGFFPGVFCFVEEFCLSEAEKFCIGSFDPLGVRR